MGLMNRFKEMFSKSKSETSKSHKKGTTINGIQTRYGKKLNLSYDEKLKLIENLTPREKETFYILLEGYSLKETAKLLNVGYSTANTYQTAIYKKLNVNSRAELLINFREMCETDEQ